MTEGASTSIQTSAEADRTLDPMGIYFRDLFLIGKREAVRLYLIRHGQAGNNVGAIDESDADLGLTETGREQARRLGERMAEYGVDAIYSSPLKRALETAKPIADRTGLPVQIVDDLREVATRYDGGIRSAPLAVAEQLSEADIRAALAARPRWDSYPGAESSDAFRRRIVAAMDGIIRDNPGRRVAVVCHGGVIQAYVAEVLGLETDFPYYCFNASICSIRALGNRRALWRLNDVAHLEGLSASGGIT